MIHNNLRYNLLYSNRGRLDNNKKFTKHSLPSNLYGSFHIKEFRFDPPYLSPSPHSDWITQMTIVLVPLRRFHRLFREIDNKNLHD